MKISKVFHFLYASLLALPLVAIASSCLVYAFNKEVETPRNEVNINYKYETNEVNTIDDFVIGNAYTINLEYGSNFDDYIHDVDYYQITFKYLSSNGYVQYPDGNYEDSDTILAVRYKDIHLTFDSNLKIGIEISWYDYNDYGYNLYYTTNDIYGTDVFNNQLSVLKLDVVLTSIVGSFGAIDNGFISKCENIPIESIEVIEEENPVEKVFYRAVDYVEQSSLFKWSYDSFLYAPFGYITSLFSLPENNIVAFMMSYWLTISICWLCFDVVMYVPLLVHKWLDKGAID